MLIYLQAIHSAVGRMRFEAPYTAFLSLAAHEQEGEPPERAAPGKNFVAFLKDSCFIVSGKG